MIPRSLLKTNGKARMKQNFWPCVLAAILMGVANASLMQFDEQSGVSVGTGVLTLLQIFLSIFVLNVLKLGAFRFFMLNQQEDQVPLGVVGDGFKNGNYGNVVVTMFLMDIKLVLWTFLFVIPGIIKYYEYRMVPYILAENPGMQQKDIFALSKRMMSGKKMQAFCLDLSFIGWVILGVCTLGIALIFYVNPYIQATQAELYAFNKAQAFEEGYIE